MSDEMVREFLTRLDKLGELVGEGGVYAWETFVRQTVVVSGLYNASVGLLLIALVVVAGRPLVQHFGRLKAKNPYEDWEFGIGSVYIIGTIMAIIGLIMALTAVPYLINPEYYAIKDLLNTLKP